ncbi:agmatinase family protein [Reichenbachiella carrageenanivorans]|uniref:Agmatinase family protein n=1 Tax=Reichenbachiella carrageenanivorans TaxID=2979869 RepID=A0ABY6CZM3_9BACT|nr:agmatinase family protein [Reichenbachiella carrageenanivorans]UXX78840.1 agmatinase family protein [Reichenbachiella carrageenanivorans]
MSTSENYDPSAVGVRGSIFGLPFEEADAQVVILPVPWDATVSYSAGTAEGPQAILDASAQLDLEVVGREAPWKQGIWMAPIDEEIRNKSQDLRLVVEPYIEALEAGQEYLKVKEVIAAVDQGTTALKAQLKDQALAYLNKGKIVGLLGGDHSTPLGYLEALNDKYEDFGILQIDAHLDLRKAYEGFKHSHASIMYNALKLPNISKLVQVGIRDFCEEEMELVKSDERVAVYFDQELKWQQFEGTTWQSLCKEMVAQLPDKVYISFDIDGLQPFLCPGTGTPVPGGLSFEEAVYLINQVKASGREVIGFDLNEVAPQPDDKEWNANVAARVLYALCGLV